MSTLLCIHEDTVLLSGKACFYKSPHFTSCKLETTFLRGNTVTVLKKNDITAQLKAKEGLTLDNSVPIKTPSPH